VLAEDPGGNRFRGLAAPSNIYLPLDAARSWKEEHPDPLSRVALRLARKNGTVSRSQRVTFTTAVVRVNDPIQMQAVRTRLSQLGFGLVGGILGALLAWGVDAVANRLAYRFILQPQGVDYLEFFHLPPALWICAVALALLVSMLAAFYPTARAAPLIPLRRCVMTEELSAEISCHT
jgi:hypothetical protein